MKKVMSLTVEYKRMGTALEPLVVANSEDEELRFWVLLPEQKEKLEKLLKEIISL